MTRQGAEIEQLKDEVFALKSRVIMAEGRLPSSDPPEVPDDDAPLRPALTREEIDDLLEDTASEPDQWGFNAADL